MNIPRFLFPTIIALSLIALTSCTVFSNKGKAAKAEERGRAKIVEVDSRINANVVDKIDAIASLAYGTDYALSKINEPSREVEVARDINKRVASLAGSPTLDQMKEMQDTIDKLTSILSTERSEGKQKLLEKDQVISNLQNEAKALQVAKETEIRRYMRVAQEAAAAADAYKVELDKMNKWFGLGAVFYGLKKFIISSMWILGIGGILFIILRLVSYSNPFAASIFSIFSTIGSWFIRAIEALLPKAVSLAGHTANKVFNVYKSTLWKIVDGIQTTKDRSAAASKTPSLNDVLNEVSKSMNEDEKLVVEEIKKALHWK
jgi:ElaB/YqjD/DUF883 family membrane-anchored ribosome-binding protein